MLKTQQIGFKHQIYKKTAHRNYPIMHIFLPRKKQNQPNSPEYKFYLVHFCVVEYILISKYFNFKRIANKI